MKSAKKVLVIVAHPDDEILGCGGSMARHAQSGDKVAVVIMADGVSSRTNSQDQSLFERLERRRNAAIDANRTIGVQEVKLFTFPDNRMDGEILLDVVKIIEAEIDAYQPEIIYTHASCDVNIDHCVVHEAVIVAARPQPGQPIKTLLFFETPSSTEWRPPTSNRTFMPNWFVDISETISLKIKALNLYDVEMRAHPHPRSIKSVESLARWRGSSVGVGAAEAFELGRMIS